MIGSNDRFENIKRATDRGTELDPTVQRAGMHIDMMTRDQRPQQGTEQTQSDSLIPAPVASQTEINRAAARKSSNNKL